MDGRPLQCRDNGPLGAGRWATAAKDRRLPLRGLLELTGFHGRLATLSILDKEFPTNKLMEIVLAG